jgi:cell division protein ZapA (FtsZ GTPase activity inhibitor)
MTHNPLAQAEFARVARNLDAATADIGAVMHQLSLKALGVIENTMHDASSEALRLKAAQDLADRGPQTSKVQRHQMETFNVSAELAKDLAAAMVESARVRKAFAHLSTGTHDATGVSTPQIGDGTGSE